MFSFSSIENEFNPALVYAFDPSAPCDFDFAEESASSLHYAMHICGQFHDMSEAYNYATTTILPELRQDTLARLSTDQFIFWLDELHKRLALTMEKDVNTGYSRIMILAG